MTIGSYPVEEIRSHFPALAEQVNDHPLTYLDSASSAQKPRSVVECVADFYLREYAAVHRGFHTQAIKATQQLEDVRRKVADFIGASSPEEIVFTKGATEGINLVANSWGRNFTRPGDSLVITEMEHHANIVPWQMLAAERNLELRCLPLLPDGRLHTARLPELIDERTRLLAITQLSNATGTPNPLDHIIDDVRRLSDALILVDGAQGILHQKTDVQHLGCDFYVFSGHKLYGPSGTGILYGKKPLLERMPPWEGGGAMIREVNLIRGTTFNEPPWCFEAGSPNVGGIIGLGAALDYLQRAGVENILEHERRLLLQLSASLQQIPNLTLYGSSDRVGMVSFNLARCHPHDVGILLDSQGIAIRTGHLCAMPLMANLGIPGMCRASLALYSSSEDISRLCAGLRQVRRQLG